MIDPCIWESQDFGKLSMFAKLVFIGLFSQADDEGIGRANPQYIKNTLFPYDEKVTKKDIESSLQEIAVNMSIKLYHSGDNEYYFLLNWNTWQKINRPQVSKLPKPDDGEIFDKLYTVKKTDKTLSVLGDETSQLVSQIVNHLNLRAGTNYKAKTASTQHHIKARINEGFLLNDFKIVIDKKCVEWQNSEMSKYLRPETLFGTKFESYLNQPSKFEIEEAQKRDVFDEIRDDYYEQG